ncbi:MAG TPA: GNAT family N-acetyltransferase [Pseudonocardiaceae bacterium]|nr:GNAT family N-acetyltransferase [Pseudonocardiaceae bacterium]
MVLMEMRRAGDNDWERIWPIWHEVVAAGETYPWAQDTPKDQARQLWMLPAPAEVWVATSGPEIIGTAVLRPNHPGRGSHIANAGFMVATRATGQGIGRRMGEHIMRRARVLGYLGMQFNAVVATNQRSIGLWRSLGFSIIGTVPQAFRHPRHGLVGLHIMYRTL